MAYIPSECTLQEYEEQVYSGSNNHRLYIKYGDTIIGDEANEYASPFASSLKWTRRLLDNGSKTFNLDCFVSQEIELVLNDYVIQDITQEIDIKIGTYIEKLNKWVYIPLGKYLVQDNPTTNENRTTYKLKDKSKLFDFKYNAEPLITSKGGKATLLEILDDICSQANVNYVGSRTFSGYNEQIGIYDNTINARIYVSYIAEQSGSIATIDRNGNLTFIKIKQSELTTREVSEDIVEGFTDGDNFIISKVVYESGIIKYEKGNDNNDTLYINSANPYVSNQTQVDNIYNIVNGLNINSFAISKIYGNPTFDPWDLIVLNYEGKTYKTFAQYIFTFNGVFTSKYETTIEHSAKKQNVSINSEATFRKYAKTTIDNIEAKVNIATGKVEQLEKEVTTIKETNGNNSLYVEDALESRVLEYGIDGKSEQDGTPTPDTPVEIKNVDGIRNLLNLTNNTGLSNGVSYEVTNDNQISFSGTSTTTYCDISPRFTTKTLPKGTYTFSVDKPINAQIVFYAYYNDTQYTYLRIEKNTTSITIDIPNDTIKFFVGLTGLTSGNTYSGTINLQLEKGSVAHSIVPYGSNYLVQKINGKNILNNKNYSLGTISSGTGESTTSTGSYRFDTYTPVKANTKIYLLKALCIYYYDKDKKYISFDTTGDLKPTTPKNAFYVRFRTFATDFETFNNENYMVSYEPITNYEPYKENITLIDLKDNELCSIGDIKDNLIVNLDGTTIIEKKIGKYQCTGDEDINRITTKTSGNYRFSIGIGTNNVAKMESASGKNYIYCNLLNAINRDMSYNEHDGICYGHPTLTSYKDFVIYTDETKNMTIDEFKTWLSENNVTVYYVLAEPYTIDLGQVDISLFENINHINLLDDIETDTRVKYLINNVMNGTYATKGELELTNEQFQTTITNEFNSLERQMSSITQTGGAIDIALQSSKDYTDSKNESLDNRITNSENNYNDLNNKYNTLNGKITDMNFSFKTDGLTIGTSGSEINSKLDNKGLKIYNASTLIAIFNQNGSGFKKLIVEESIQIQNLLIQKRTMNTPKANNMEVISFFFNTQETTIEKIEELDK